MAVPPLRVRFLIRETANLQDELDQLARIISSKYQRDVQISLKKVRKR